MAFFLSGNCALKLLESPSVYHIGRDELYELDEEAFETLKKCSADEGFTPKDLRFTDYCLREGIVSEEKPFVKRPPLIKSSEPSLRYLEVQITLRCNLRCRHCYIGPQKEIELRVDDIKKIMDDFQKMQGLRALITGGEPLMHGDFDEINALLPEYALRKVLFTNGTLLTGKKLKKLNVDEIQISIDGLEKAHDSLRGRGSFGKAVKALKDALEAGFEASVSTMIHCGNLDDFDSMDVMFREMGIKDWNVDVPCPIGSLTSNLGYLPAPETAGRYLNYGFGDGLHGGGRGFACGAHLMSVLADGRCAKCSFYAESPLGDFKEGLEVSRKRQRHTRLRELKCDCRAKDVCRGGCRWRASSLGDPLGRDLYKCRQYDSI